MAILSLVSRIKLHLWIQAETGKRCEFTLKFFHTTTTAKQETRLSLSDSTRYNEHGLKRSFVLIG
ncbi:MAG: hypothetical protein CMM07_05130 [Rhodopirellula sp.]|nr:hypothetical protein [Rhodopirellula sp.]